ncbi:MAG: TIGR01777 family oxidoreductase [Phycisphaerae bacterium]|nr:TIGR01777 family oxidoreductase [Phycisphaerae bacterium]
MRVFVTGGTGLIGRRLVPALAGQGHQLVVLSRSPSGFFLGGPKVDLVRGDPTKPGDWQDAVPECDAVVNLAGENVMSKRWNDEHKRQIRDSRILATRNVVEAIGRSDGRCNTLINASAVGYYGNRGDEWLEESAPPGDDFLAGVCTDWEAEADAAARHGARVVRVRTGVVLDNTGGALAELVEVFRKFIGGPVGSGRQWVSWVHHEDAVGVFCLALNDAEISGPINACSPNPVTNRELAKAIGRALQRPTVLRVPASMLRMAVGEAADMALASQRLRPQAVLDRGYRFRFEQLDAALADLLASA